MVASDTPGPSRGAALVINVDALPGRGPAHRVLADQIALAGPDVDTVIAVASTTHAIHRFAAAAKAMGGVMWQEAKKTTQPGEVATIRALNMRSSGKFTAVHMAPFTPARQHPAPASDGPSQGRDGPLLLIDLENITGGHRGSRPARLIRSLLEAAGPCCGAVAVVADKRPAAAYAQACARYGVQLVRVRAGSDAADARLVELADFAADEGLCNRFIVASGDHYFTRLSHPFDVVIPAGKEIARKLTDHAQSVVTFAA